METPTYHPTFPSGDTESIQSSEASLKKKKGFWGSSKSSVDSIPKAKAVKKAPVAFQTNGQQPGHFIYGQAGAPRVSTARAPPPFVRKDKHGNILNPAPMVHEIPLTPKASSIASSAEADAAALKAVKAARRQSLQPQSMYRPTLKRRPSDPALAKPSFSAPTPAGAEPPVSPQRAPVLPHPVDRYQREDRAPSLPSSVDRSRGYQAAESTTSSMGNLSHRESGLWADQWSSLSHAPASKVPSLLDLKDLQLIEEDESTIPTFPAATQSAFDSATRNLSKILGLSLCYLVALDLTNLPTVPALTLLSSTGLTSPPPAFDPKLHFEALRAPERGLLYQRNRASALKHGHQAGMLVPVSEVAQVGYVLCGFTDRVEREFDDRDVRYLRRFATELENWVTKTT